MKTKVLFMAILLLFPISVYVYAQNSKLYVYIPDIEKDETACGYVDSKGRIVIPVGKYANIFTAEFDKIAFVAIKGKQGVYAIDRKEKVLFKVYSYMGFPDDVSSGLFRIIENDKIGFANMDGQIVIKPQFQFVYPFTDNGFAIFCKNGTWSKLNKEIDVITGKWGAIDKTGKIIIPATFEHGYEKYLGTGEKLYELDKEGKLKLRSK